MLKTTVQASAIYPDHSKAAQLYWHLWLALILFAQVTLILQLALR